MKALIVIDSYKLPIFSKALVAAKFPYAQEETSDPKMYSLVVEFEESRKQELAQVVARANSDARIGKHRPASK